jgi:hypothetical protein
MRPAPGLAAGCYLTRCLRALQQRSGQHAAVGVRVAQQQQYVLPQPGSVWSGKGWPAGPLAAEVLGEPVAHTGAALPGGCVTQGRNVDCRSA